MQTAESAAASLWSVDECAKFLGKSRRWVWSAVARCANRNGSIPYVRVGRTPRFFPADIIEWARLNCPPAEVVEDLKGSRKSRLKTS
jgi:predicted DNA-binding transcriptional regulator AlpA